MTIDKKRDSFLILIGLTVIILLGHLYVGFTTPFSKSWGIWLLVVFVSIILYSIIFQKTIFLKLSKILAYLGLSFSALSIIVGVIGLFIYSTSLAAYLVIGFVYGLISLILLAGIKESIKMGKK